MRSQDKSSAADEKMPEMAEAPGGPMASYMREVKELRRQMAEIPKLSNRKEIRSQEILHLPQSPGRRSKLSQALIAHWSPVGCVLLFHGCITTLPRKVLKADGHRDRLFESTLEPRAYVTGWHVRQKFSPAACVSQES